MRSLLTIARGVLLAILLMATVPAQSLTTNFNGNTGQQGNMFDVKSLTGVIITGLDIHFTGTADFEVWTLSTPGTYLGNQSNMAAWTLQGGVTGLVSAGMNTPTPLGIPLTIPVPAGITQAIYVTAAPTGGSATVWYNTGTQGALAASDANLEIYVGNSGSYFSATITGREWNGTIHYQLASTNADDIALTSIDSPNDSVGCDPLTTTESVQATIVNLGSNTIASGNLIQFDLVVDGGAPITEFVPMPAAVPQGSTYQHTFMANVDLSAAGAHTIDVSASLNGDMDPTNDASSKTVNSGGAVFVTAFPWSENFDASLNNGSTAPPTGWAQDPNDGGGTGGDTDWYFRNTATTSTNTGPQADHTTGITGGGYYAYVEDSGGNHPAVNLDTPCLDLSTTLAPQLVFWTHSFNNTVPTTTNENFLSVDVLTYPGGIVTMDAFGPVGHDPLNASYTGSQWRSQIVDLTAFIGQTVQLRFRGRSDGGGFTHDIAIDDVLVFEPLPTPGQAPRPGLAVMDINGATNGNASPVSVGNNGPYFTSASVGAPMDFGFSGEPNAPIVLLSGVLNPVNASYPNIGQFDIGGSIDPQGIPTGLAVIADGFNPTTLINQIFNTGPTAQLDLSFQTPGYPSGVLTTFQPVFSTTNGSIVALANAVELTIN